MPDGEVVRGRLEALNRYVDLLRAMGSITARQLTENFERQLAVLHALQLAIECVQDIAAHLVATESLGRPQSHQEAIELLAQAGVIDEDLKGRLRGMPGFRNIVVHEYLQIDLQRVVGFIGALDDFDRFGDSIVRFLDSR